MSSVGENDFVTLIASLKGREPIRCQVRKDLIQSESSFLKEYMEEGAAEIRVPLRRPKNLDSILKFVSFRTDANQLYFYGEQLTDPKEKHLESLWNDARILGLVNLEKNCIQRLTDTISLDSWIQRLEFARTEGCHELESSVLSFVNANLEDCCKSSSFGSLNVDQMVQMLQLPTMKSTVTESVRIVGILEWTSANKKDRCPQAHRLLEQVDLMKLSEHSLRSFFDEESSFRHWRCVAIFEKAIRLKKLEETARLLDTVRAPLDQFELSAAHPIMSDTLEGTRMIKQEVASLESFDAEDLQVNELHEDVSTKNTEDYPRARTSSMKQEFSPPLPSLSSVVNAIIDTFQDNNAEDPSPPKISRQEYSQADPFAIYQPGASNQKQILYLRQNGQHGYNLNSVILNGDSVSQAERVKVNLPYYNNHVPKLIWSEEARGLFLLGGVNNGGRVLSTVRYMNWQRPLVVTERPKMFRRRHRFQAVVLNGRLYVMGGSRCVLFNNRKRRFQAEVLDVTADSSGWKWQQIASTPMECDLFTAANAGGRIYMIGGLRDTKGKGENNKPVVTNEVICYEPTTNNWTFVSSMGFPRCGHASAVVGRRIYVMGGCNLNYTNPQNDLANMMTAEVYDIDENWWTITAPMQSPRFGGSAMEMDGKIYVFGGDYNSEGQCRPSVECYDPVSDSWTYVSTSFDNQDFFDSIAVIDNPEYFL